LSGNKPILAPAIQPGITPHLGYIGAEAMSGALRAAKFTTVCPLSCRFSALGFDPFAALSESELIVLRHNIQKRHVIGHNLGLADKHYVELTQDEQPGETVRLIGDEIRQFAELCLRVVSSLDDRLLPEACP
jgi:hypothetical protein